MENFVTFEIAKKLKEKGFREKCIGYYDYSEEFHYNYESAISNKEIYFCHNKYDNIWHRDLIDAPTISQVLKWLRKEYKLYVCPAVIADYQDDFHRDITYWSFTVINIEPGDSIYREYERVVENRYDTYEQAALAGIEYVLNNLI